MLLSKQWENSKGIAEQNMFHKFIIKIKIEIEKLKTHKNVI